MHRQIPRLQPRIVDNLGQSRHGHARRGLRIAPSPSRPPAPNTEARRADAACAPTMPTAAAAPHRSGAQAGVTSDANGCPLGELASVPTRAARSSLRASQPGELSRHRRRRRATQGRGRCTTSPSSLIRRKPPHQRLDLADHQCRRPHHPADRGAVLDMDSARCTNSAAPSLRRSITATLSSTENAESSRIAS